MMLTEGWVTQIITSWYFSISMFRFSDQVWKGMQMTEVMTLLTSVSGHAIVKSFSGTDVTQRCCQTNEPKHKDSFDAHFYEVTKERHSVRAASRFSLKVLRVESDLCELNRL